jgi:3-deoxy-manno-octulosonate cytidylyltransferase (CMP-KDO synthetase)
VKTIAIIPARYASTRFPAKLLADLGGKSIIRRTYDNTVATGLFDDVLVATDSDLIFDEITRHGGKAVMSQKPHESGSDRIAEAVIGIEADIVVNVQGDEPFLDREPLEKLLDVFRGDSERKIDLASLMRPISGWDEIQNPNNVKVVTDNSGFALYFSRSAIPFPRDEKSGFRYMQHIGVYAFRRQAILDFAKLSVTPLEASEKLEQLRYLESGRRIRMVETAHVSIGIDTPEDLVKAKKLL